MRKKTKYIVCVLSLTIVTLLLLNFYDMSDIHKNGQSNRFIGNSHFRKYLENAIETSTSVLDIQIGTIYVKQKYEAAKPINDASMHGILINALEKESNEDSNYVENIGFLNKFEQTVHVKNCISGDIIANYSESPEFKLRMHDYGIMETMSQREVSFKEVFSRRAWGHDWDPSYQGLNASGKRRLKVLDVPCGDFAWMNRYLQTRQDIDYTGMDIVDDLIRHHKKEYGGFRHWRFILADVLSKHISLDNYDVILIRMMLQHLYFNDVQHLLEKVSNSSSKFVIMTTFPRHKKNEELVINQENPGRFRFLNLELPPFSLSPPLCLQRDGPLLAYQGWDHFVGVWSIPLKRVPHCTFKKHYVYHIPDTPVDVHTCTKIYGSESFNVL